MTKVATMRVLTVVPTDHLVCAKFQRDSWWVQPPHLAWLLTQNAAKAFENALYIVIDIVLRPDSLLSHSRRFSDGRTTEVKTEKCCKCVYRIN